MKKILIISFCMFFINSCKNKTSQKLSVVNQVTLNDTLFFQCKNVFGENSIISDKQHSNLYSVIKKTDSFYSIINYTTRNDKIISKGGFINFNKTKPFNAKREGKWFFYGDGDMGLYKIANYKNGKKDGIWYTKYEDAFPKLAYYRNDVQIAYNDSIIILDDNNSRIVFGKGITQEGIPIGEWSFYLANGNILSRRRFLKKKGKLIVKYKNFDAKTNAL